jgi:hypothetical protein
VIASGFSVLHETFQGASLGQIIIPGMREYLSNDRIREAIGDSETEYLFTWGRAERAVYGVEAWYGCTRTFFSGLRNVTCISHGEGHIFQPDIISMFLEDIRRFSKKDTEGEALLQNAPNPFASSTRISFLVEAEGRVTLAVFDATGRLVKPLVDDILGPDLYTVEWDGTNEDGRSVASGAYFYRLETPDSKEVKKMTLAR